MACQALPDKAVRLNISVPADLAAEVRASSLNVSAVCQRALREALDAGPREYHYVMALQWLDGAREAFAGTDGTITLHPWATRSEVISHVRELAGIPEGFTGDGLITYFSLEPETVLPHAGSLAGW